MPATSARDGVRLGDVPLEVSERSLLEAAIVLVRIEIGERERVVEGQLRELPRD
jgi:hypothetical protein